METVRTNGKNCFIEFRRSVADISLPTKFTFPFYYEPHPLCVLAAEELQQYLETQTEWVHNFGLVEGQAGLVIGKMFGVMVVQNSHGELGYLAAFSGKLAGGNHHTHFVPPVFDMLTDGSFFLTGEEELTRLTHVIDELERSPELANSQAFLAHQQALADQELKELRKKIKENKKRRKAQREMAEKELDTQAFLSLQEELRKESVKEQYFLKDLNSQWRMQLDVAKNAVNVLQKEIADKKEERKAKSAALQQRLFLEYHFLNQRGEKKSLLDIFETELEISPPAGAGECAAPKLLQYAFLHGLKPIAIAEFWWGASPASEVRKHGLFYPACRGKCEPILSHMLAGIETDENPLIAAPDETIRIETVYEDEYIVVLNKPAELLSVPGINVQDSVYLRMKQKYPDATGPLIVHRLDMSTSGLMLIAKTKEAYLHLQSQFIKRSVKKRYVALLEGVVSRDEGFINLPLRVDLEDRPRQLVCYEYGKSAQTRWQVICRENNRTRVLFFPFTGRTHQLRVHASHALGLNAPIVGDDLYGTKADRLHLHAAWIEFRHPQTNEIMTLEADAPF